VLIMPRITHAASSSDVARISVGSQAAARKTDASDACRNDVRSRSQDVERNSVLVGDHRRQAGSQRRAVLGNHVLMQIGRAASNGPALGGILQDRIRRGRTTTSGASNTRPDAPIPNSCRSGW
jgi:hypothetical protein